MPWSYGTRLIGAGEKQPSRRSGCRPNGQRAGVRSLQLLSITRTDKIPTADSEHPAIEVLAVWQAAEGPGLGGIPTRGFARADLLLYSRTCQPVAVDGKAQHIYVFDNHGSAEEQARPLRQFDFDRQSWTAHLQTSKLGPTYRVFIPYPREDYHQAVCSLRIRFTPPKGRPLFSASSTIVLPGPPLSLVPRLRRTRRCKASPRSCRLSLWPGRLGSLRSSRRIPSRLP